MPKSLRKRLLQVTPHNRNSINPLVVSRFFHPTMKWEWYITEYYPDHEDRLYGWMSGAELDMAFFLLQELQEMNVLGHGVKRDERWTEMRLNEVKAYAEA